MIWLLLFVLVAVCAGRLRLPLWAGWLVVFGLVGATHVVLVEADPIVRMVGICVVLLAGMKGLVYRAWGGSLAWPSYGVFCFAWFGMDPGSFVKRRERLTWKEDIKVGVILMAVGTLLIWLVWVMEWRHVLVMFVPMSLWFHFGALRVLKGGLRKAGYPVRTLFPNVLKAKGLADFWSRRWNVGYSQMMQRMVGRQVAERWGRGAGVFSVFLVSGLLHEAAITLPVQQGYGLPTLYFSAHGALVLTEAKWGISFGRIASLLLVAAPLGFLFPVAFQTEVIARFLLVFEYIL